MCPYNQFPISQHWNVESETKISKMFKKNFDTILINHTLGIYAFAVDMRINICIDINPHAPQISNMSNLAADATQIKDGHVAVLVYIMDM